MNGTDWEDLFPDSGRLDGLPVSELLSAYHDGELSAEERLRVDAWLEKHPRGRELLAQFSELSLLVGQAGVLSPRDLTEVGTHGLPQRVLSRLATDASPAGRFQRSWRRWGIALVAAAASLGLVVLLVPPGPRPNQVAMNAKAEVPPELQEIAVPKAVAITADSRKEENAPKLVRQAAEAVRGQADAVSTVPVPAKTIAGMGRPSQGFDASAPLPGPVATPAPAPAPRLAAEGNRPGMRLAPAMTPLSAPAPGSAPAPAAAASPLSPVAPPRSAAPESGSSLPQLAPGTKVDPGEIIHHLATQGDEAVVIEYTVVDVRKTAGELEILLRRHGIETLRPEAPAASKPGPMEASMFAIYVEAGDDQLAAALKEFQTLPTSVDVIAPQLASRARGSGNGGAAAGEKAKDTGSPKKGSPDSGSSGPDKSRDRMKPFEPEGQIANGGPMRTERGNARDQGYQVPFALSPSDAEQLPRRSQNVPKQQRYDEYVQQRRSGEPKADAADASSRVLIVLQARETDKM